MLRPESGPRMLQTGPGSLSPKSHPSSSQGGSGFVSDNTKSSQEFFSRRLTLGQDSGQTFLSPRLYWCPLLLDFALLGWYIGQTERCPEVGEGTRSSSFHMIILHSSSSFPHCQEKDPPLHSHCFLFWKASFHICLSRPIPSFQGHSFPPAGKTCTIF